MAKITNAAYFMAGSLSIGADEYTAAVDSCTLTPTTTTTGVTDISGATSYVAGDPMWALALSVVQDTVTVNSLTQYLIANRGTKKDIVFTPKTGGKGFTLKALIIPGAIGGAGGAIAKSQVTLPVDGQPTIA